MGSWPYRIVNQAESGESRLSVLRKSPSSSKVSPVLPPPPHIPSFPYPSTDIGIPSGLLSGSPCNSWCRLPESPSVWYRFTAGVRVPHHDLSTWKDITSQCQEKVWETPSCTLKSSGASRIWWNGCLAPPEEAQTAGDGAKGLGNLGFFKKQWFCCEGPGDVGGWDREGRSRGA